MRQDSKNKIDRRDLLRVLGVSAGVAATPVGLVAEAHADSESNDEKRKARYNANSEDVKAFYRVNEYPK
jgi:lipid-binding SYLF domain-containing protein